MIPTFPFSFLFALTMATLATPAPVSPSKGQSLIAFAPKITSPKVGAQWPMGTTHNVTWDTSHIPHEVEKQPGLVWLGHWSDEEHTNENLNTSHPLARDFPINQGWVTIRIPTDIPPSEDYFVVLFGDSGNTSPTFNVTRPVGRPRPQSPAEGAGPHSEVKEGSLLSGLF